MYCTKCGNAIIEGNRFCTRCGTPVTNYAPAADPDATVMLAPKAPAADPDATVMLAPKAPAADPDATVMLAPKAPVADPDATVMLAPKTPVADPDATEIISSQAPADATEILSHYGASDADRTEMVGPGGMQGDNQNAFSNGLGNMQFDNQDDWFIKAQEKIQERQTENNNNQEGSPKKPIFGILIGVLSLIIGILAIVLVVLGIRFFSNNDKGETEDGGNGLFGRGGKTYIINLYGADDTTGTAIADADISVFEIGDTEKEVKSKIFYDAEKQHYEINKVKEGSYLFKITAVGYCEYTKVLNVEEGGSADMRMTPKPLDGMNIFRVDWKGEQDIDLCIYSSSREEYISVGNATGEYEGCIKADNDGSTKYELFYLPAELSREGNWNLYVVDSTAAQNDATSTMEADGVSVTCYNSTGEIYTATADTANNMPVWFVGTLEGETFNEKNEYLGDCKASNSWTQAIKLGFAGRLRIQVEELNMSGEALKSFDPAEENYKPGTRNDEQCWDSTVFYALEEHQTAAGYYDKNQCILKKLQVRNRLTGNVVDYDAYLNPDTGLPNKIVSIEYKDGAIDVMEYYYDNDGKISFIFYYLTDNYVSTYATVNKPGNRFLFDEDCMTTWRIIENNKITNLCSNKAEEARLKEGSWKKNSIFRHDKLREDEKHLYDEMEYRMINYAYNTYDLICNNEGVGQIIGAVYKDDYVPAPNAVVELYDDSFENLLYSATTDSNGEYDILVPYMEYTYNIRVKSSSAGDSVCDVYQIEMEEGSFIVYIDSVLFFSNSASKQTVKLYIGNAFIGHGASVGDADVYVRSGVNNRRGTILESLKTDSEGYVEMYLLPGMYTVEASKEGYESIYYTIISNPYEDNWYEYYTPPTLSEGEYAIVLSWGYSPYDLDSHLFTSSMTDSQHIWYQNKYDGYDSYLDVDDTDSYGPETITIRKFDANKYYKYCIVDYTNSSRGNYYSTDMSYSSATVTVYSNGGHVATYHVPVNKEGVVWEVFEIRNGRLTPIQRYYTGMEDNSWWNH